MFNKYTYPVTFCTLIFMIEVSRLYFYLLLLITNYHCGKNIIKAKHLLCNWKTAFPLDISPRVVLKIYSDSRQHLTLTDTG